jgi:hypothetical protein
MSSTVSERNEVDAALSRAAAERVVDMRVNLLCIGLTFYLIAAQSIAHPPQA